jgi:hypothetical protein
MVVRLWCCSSYSTQHYAPCAFKLEPQRYICNLKLACTLSQLYRVLCKSKLTVSVFTWLIGCASFVDVLTYASSRHKILFELFRWLYLKFEALFNTELLSVHEQSHADLSFDATSHYELQVSVGNPKLKFPRLSWVTISIQVYFRLEAFSAPHLI